MILKCSAPEEKKYKKCFGELIAHFSESKEIEQRFPYSLPVFRCTDMARVAGMKGLQQVVSYSQRSFSPANHVRVGTIYGDSYEQLQTTIESLRQMEDMSVG
jgi:hypothetical protein